ncbi:MAG: hypothetical protein JWN13_2533 [Betaproteobacteria bacterium]|nr:hypothetical protein [Betaproteobacteria bacterium]
MCSVHDTIEFEKRGIPATVIITQAFKNACVFQFRGKGMENHPYVELPHPISNLKPEEMRELTLKYIDQVVRQLTA